jgi:hypothetical protein
VRKTSSPKESVSSRRLLDNLRFEIITKTLTESDWTAERAAEVLHLTMRQVFRLKAKVLAAGEAGIVHGNRGRTPINAKPAALRRQIIRLYDRDYREEGWNYAAFTDALNDKHDIHLSRETIRTWLPAAKLGHKVKRYHIHRQHRERAPRMGQMLFLDGSPHRWFGPDCPNMTLILATDDATGPPLYGLFRPQETRDGCFEVFYHLALRHGLPESLYLDRASQFTTTRHGGTHYRQVSDAPTAFEIAMQKLGVKLIFANRPQARGRGERMNGTFQGRLVAELRHEKIATAEAASEYLNASFIPSIARRFGVPARDSRTAFRPVPSGLDLRTVLCAESIRTVGSDNTIALHGYRYQLLPPHVCPVLTFCRVKVQEWFDQTVHIYYQHFGELHNQLIPHRDALRLKYRHRPSGL